MSRSAGRAGSARRALTPLSSRYCEAYEQKGRDRAANGVAVVTHRTEGPQRYWIDPVFAIEFDAGARLWVTTFYSEMSACIESYSWAGGLSDCGCQMQTMPCDVCPLHTRCIAYKEDKS